MRNIVKALSGLVSISTVLALTVSGAWAQWVNVSVKDPEYTTAANWSGGVINDRLVGAIGATQTVLPTVAFENGSNVITISAFDARKLSVGQSISGAGIPDGAYITAINNSGQITISAPATNASSGALTVTGWGKYNGYSVAGQSNIQLSFIDGSLTYELPAGFDLSSIKLGQRVTTVTNISGTGVDSTIASIDTANRTITLAPGSKSSLPVTGSGAFNFNQLNWNININVSRVFTGDFVYANNDPFDMSITPGNSTKMEFTAPKVNFVVDIGGTGTAKQFTFGSSSRTMSMDFHGAEVNFIIDPSSNLGSNYNVGNLDLAVLAASSTGIGAMIKSGAGVLKLQGGVNQNWAVAGPVTVSGGVLNVQSANQNLTGPRITGATRYDVVGPGSALVLDVSGNAGGQTVSVPNLIESSAGIHLYSGALGARSNASTYNLAQSVGNVTLHGGRNVIGIAQSSSNFVFTVNTIERRDNATLNLFGGSRYNAPTDTYFGIGSAGASALKVTNDGNLLVALTGGGGAAGSQTVSIIPWITMTGSTYSSGYNQDWIGGDLAQYGGVDFVTYTSAGGFRGLAPSEYDNTLTAAVATGVHSNVWLTINQTLTAAQTVNALKIGAGVTLTANNTLTVSSGAILGANFNDDKYISGTGALNSGANPFYIYGSNKLTVSAALNNSVSGIAPGLIIASAGQTILSGTNNYGGSTLVQGVARLQNSKAVTNSELRVDRGGSVTIAQNSATQGSQVQITKLSGLGTVNFSGETPTGGNWLSIGGSTGAANTITVNSGGILAPGDADGQYQAGTLMLGDKVAGLTLKAGSLFEFDVFSDTFSDMVSSLNPAATLTLDDGAIVRLNFNGYTPSVDDTAWLLTSGFANLNLGEVIIKDQNNNLLEDYKLSAVNGNLLLTYATIPEPGAWLLLSVSGGLLAVLRRRR